MKTENTRLTCPDCGGAVQRIQQDGGLTQYRCRVGHLYSPQNALAIHADREENTLWTAVVLLEEGAELAEEIAKLPSIHSAENLKTVSSAKRRLAEQVKAVVSKFAEIPMHLNGSDPHE